jgi:LTR polyprotein gag-polypeptide-like protein
MKVTHRWDHFISAKPCPKPKVTDKPIDAEREAIEKWEHENAIASYLLSQHLLDITVICLTNCLTAHNQWKMVTKEYQAKSAYTQADLHQSFLKICCAKGGDVREFLGNLCYKREELAASGIDITDKEYERTILQGIPTKLATFALHILSLAHLIHGATSINTDALINQICEEAE